VFRHFASASAVNVEAILGILSFMLRPSFISIDANPANGLPSLFEPSVAKYLLVLILAWNFFLISRCDPLLPLFIFPHRKLH
jgi:hypothetical protein